MRTKDIVVFTAVGCIILAAILAYCFVSYSRDQWDFHEWNERVTRLGNVRHYRVSGLKMYLMCFGYFILSTSMIPILVNNSREDGW
jgi:nitrate/nitrite transporter NarK